jgi:uroporphyrinogen decarboxylase
MYKLYAFPFEKRIIDFAHKMTLPYALHICGNTEIILKQMTKTGADALELDHKTDIYKIHKICQNKVTLIGTIDPSGILAMGSTEDVERKALDILQIYKNSPKFIMNAGCALPPNVPSDNIRCLIEITHSY